MIGKVAIGLLVAMLTSACSVPQRLLQPLTVDGPQTLAPYPTQTYSSNVHLFDAIDLRFRMQTEQWTARVDHLIVLWDRIGLQTPNAQAAETRSQLMDSREWLRRFNRTIPYQKLPGHFFSTGAKAAVDLDTAAGSSYTPLQIEVDLDRGASPPLAKTDSLSRSIDLATSTALALPGRSALVVITNWSRLQQDEIQALMRFHQRLSQQKGYVVANDVQSWSGKADVGGCVHLVGIGNTFSRERLMPIPNCTSAHTFSALAQPRDMAKFVSDVLFAGPADDDGDGIANFQDECPSTPPNRIVTSNGCLRFPSEAEAKGARPPQVPATTLMRGRQ